MRIFIVLINNNKKKSYITLKEGNQMISFARVVGKYLSGEVAFDLRLE